MPIAVSRALGPPLRRFLKVRAFRPLAMVQNSVSVISSVIVEDSVQADGRRWIRERHTDQAGKIYEFAYLALASDNVTTMMNARIASINAGMVADEIQKNITDVLANGSLANPTSVYATPLQSFAGLRAAYATATQREAIMIGDFLSSLTDPQLQTAFGMTAGQVTTLRTNKLTPAANLATSIRAAAGQ